MKIVISLLNFRPGKIGGTETYIRQLLPALAAIKGDDEITLLMHKDITDKMIVKGLGHHVVNKSDATVVRARFLEAITPYRARFAEKALKELAPDVVFFPQQSLFPKKVSCPSVVTVHDQQHLFFPQYFSMVDRIYRAMIYPYSAMQAARIIAISQFVARTLTQRNSTPSDKITVIPHGISPIDVDAIDSCDEIPNRYLYYPAATFPHKAHSTLFDTFAKLRRNKNFDYKLVLTGQQTAHWNQLQKQINNLGIDNDVMHLGFLPYEKVLQVFKGAEAILFPTQFEGFGLPVYEAVQYKKKIICSRLEVFDEIGVPCEFQIDFSDPDQLLAVLNHPGATNLTVQPITWGQVAEQTLDLIRTVGGTIKK